ncbi:hypothetical protein [Gulosibacter bifidus]|uniref:Lipoprotein n=1 Tax=Gulosibacter bifidus TaxID=272239 RepID=A0ABW5RKQ9_9MICO|nr:hypothetical protein [Gulosibacter bifidus]
MVNYSKHWLVASLAAGISLGLVGCVDGHQVNSEATTASSVAVSTPPVQSAFGVRDRANAIVKDMVAQIPKEFRVSDVEEERLEKSKHDLSACNSYANPDPNSWDGSYSYIGSLGVEVRSLEDATAAADLIYENFSHRPGWVMTTRGYDQQGRYPFIESSDGFQVAVDPIAVHDGTFMVTVYAFSPCFYPAESPWPSETEI